MKAIKNWKQFCSILSVILGAGLIFYPASGQAVRRIAPLEKLTPNRNLTPLKTTQCVDLLSSAYQASVREIRKSKSNSYSKKELLSFVNYLTERRFSVSSSSLTKESSTVRALLDKKFGIPLSGDDLYTQLRKSFSSFQDVILATPEGKKLSQERNDANYKTWTLAVLIKLAQECEKLEIPFDEEFLKANSSLVGMKLSEKYGYPVRGEQIVTRAEKLGISIKEIRMKAELPLESIHLQKAKAAKSEIAWTQELITKILLLLKNKGYQVAQVPLQKQRDEVSDLIWNEMGIRVTVSELESKIYDLYGGWPNAKKTIGVNYGYRTQEIPGRPDWTKEFYIQVLQFLRSKKFEVSYSSLVYEEKYAPLRKALTKRFGFDIRGKTLYEYGSELFGDFETACTAAKIPYSNFNHTQLPTEWTKWHPEISEEKLNPAIELEIFKFINSQEIEPTVALLGDIKRFAPLRESIQNQFGIDIAGKQLLAKARKYFGDLTHALNAAEITISARPVWTQELKEKALAVVYEKYPNIMAKDIMTTRSREIGYLLRDKLRIITSGYELWTQAKDLIRAKKVVMIEQAARARQAAEALRREKQEARRAARLQQSEKKKLTLRETILWNPEFTLEALKAIVEKYPDLTERTLMRDHAKGVSSLIKEKFDTPSRDGTLYNSVKKNFGSLKVAFEKMGYQAQWSRSAMPTREQIIDVLKFIDSKDFKISAFIFQTKNKFAPIQEAIKKQYGHEISGTSIYNNAVKQFAPEGWSGALRIAGIKGYTEADWTPEFFSESLKIILAKYPFLTPMMLARTRSQEIGDLLYERYGLRAKGSTYYQHLNEVMGSLDNAFEAIHYQSPWPFKGLPSKELYLEVLQYVYSQGTLPLQSTIVSEEQYEPIRKLIEDHFGLDVSGGALYKAGKRLFGSYNVALKAAGLPRRENFAAWSPDFALKALNAVAEEYPDITYRLLVLNKSKEIGALLKEKLGVEIYGTTLWSHLVEYFGDLKSALEKAQIDSNLTSQRFWPKKGLPTKENYIALLKFIDSKEFEISQKSLNSETEFAPIDKAIREHFGYSIPRVSIYKRGKRLFGSFQNGLQVAGIVSRKTPLLGIVKSKEQYIEILKLLESKNFLVSPELFTDQEKFKEVKPVIEEQYHVKAAGRPLYLSAVKLFGSFKEALQVADIKYDDGEPVWTKDFTATAFKSVLLEYPDVSYSMLLHSHSQLAGELLRRKLNVNTSGATLLKNIKKYFGSMPNALTELHYVTPWMIDNARAPKMDRDLAIKVIIRLKKLGIIARYATLKGYSPQIAFILIREFKLPMTGINFAARAKELFSEGGLTEALERAQFQKAMIYTDRTPPWKNQRQFEEILSFVEQFGFQLSRESLEKNSNAIAWAVWFRYGILASGKDLLKEAYGNGSNLSDDYKIEQTNPRENPVDSSNLDLNPYSMPIIENILLQAGIDISKSGEIDVMGPQIMNIMKFHFGKTVDLKELSRLGQFKIVSDGRAGVGDSNNRQQQKLSAL